MKFIRPIDGDVLLDVIDGQQSESGLTAKITVSAPAGREIKINGTLATEENGVYAAQILLDSYRNTVEAVDGATGEMVSMVVYWFKDAYKAYRLGVDDVIRAFENIYRHQDTYTSIFDDPFLRLFRDLHEQYGTFVHMHVYYVNDDGSFNLSMFPEKFKPEFQANGDWLKFTFHAHADQPDSPYLNASYQQVMEEGRQVEKELLRIVGKEAMSNVTSQHWANSNLWATRAFRNLGFRCIDAYFIFDEEGNPAVSYYLNKEQATHATGRDFWVDNQEDIIFVKDDIIINEIELADIDAYMDAIAATENHGFQYLLIHEQYFYEDYFNYEPDYRERIFATVDWCHRNGYRPVRISDVAFEERR